MKAFLAADPDQPIVMLNLLRFAAGGAERYDAYLAHFRPHAERVGGSVLYFGHGAPPLVAEPGQEWDAHQVSLEPGDSLAVVSDCLLYTSPSPRDRS